MATLLPPLPDGIWSDDIHSSYSQISVAVHRASQLLQEEADPLHLRIHSENLDGNIVELLDAMDASADAEGLPKDWLYRMAELVGEVIGKLEVAIETSSTQCVPWLSIICNICDSEYSVQTQVSKSLNLFNIQRLQADPGGRERMWILTTFVMQWIQNEVSPVPSSLLISKYHRGH
jgi:hypothetical protein